MTRWSRGAAGTLLLSLLPMAGAHAQGAPLGTPLPGKPLGDAVQDHPAADAFLENQLSHAASPAARDATDGELRILFHDKGVDYARPEIYLRVFKHERVMELWARSRSDTAFKLMREYPVCALPGQLGPKQRMGDFQVPEGFYFIDEFNPRSAYHLSLRVSYPNLSDRMRREAVALGGDIFVHGGCETVGCVPIENENIEEVYWLAARAMDAGQRVIPIHIFPSRMDDASLGWLERTFQPDPPLLRFWQNLAEGYAYFEETRRVPWITVGEDGRYHVPPVSRLADSAVTGVAPGQQQEH
jgi:murein L,D-transpeptidase YafK